MIGRHLFANAKNVIKAEVFEFVTYLQEHRSHLETIEYIPRVKVLEFVTAILTQLTKFCWNENKKRIFNQ